MSGILSDYFRIPEQLDRVASAPDLRGEAGFFRFGDSVVAYGQCRGGVSAEIGRDIPDALPQVRSRRGELLDLPFDLTSVVENIRRERYADRLYSSPSATRLGDLYYAVRPVLPLWLRKHVQRVYLRGWNHLPFPQWPVDFTVENLLQRVLFLLLEAHGVESVPFIWFWPDSCLSCALVTHDVETTAGRDFCRDLMDIDAAFSIPSAFQIIPEERYHVTPDFLDSLRERGFEINVHDINHDGQLFRHRESFLSRAEQINRYGEEFGARGFRSGIMYRQVEWYDALSFEYDMSVPNVARLDPQRGGCCTVMPFFIGKILEIPTTTTQDYTLFHILRDYSIGLWKRQLQLIHARNGLASFLIHPDYIIDMRARKVYEQLLQHLTALRSADKCWVTTPGDVNRWWRLRSQMELVRKGETWVIEGEGKDRARVALAHLHHGGVRFVLQPAESGECPLVPVSGQSTGTGGNDR